MKSEKKLKTEPCQEPLPKTEEMWPIIKPTERNPTFYFRAHWLVCSQFSWYELVQNEEKMMHKLLADLGLEVLKKIKHTTTSRQGPVKTWAGFEMANKIWDLLGNSKVNFNSITIENEKISALNFMLGSGGFHTKFVDQEGATGSGWCYHFFEATRETWFIEKITISYGEDTHIISWTFHSKYLNQIGQTITTK